MYHNNYLQLLENDIMQLDLKDVAPLTIVLEDSDKS